MNFWIIFPTVLATLMVEVFIASIWLVVVRTRQHRSLLDEAGFVMSLVAFGLLLLVVLGLAITISG